MKPPKPHDDADLFRAALSLTAARTGYAPRLIEKDYFCTILLEYFATASSLVFKGGTCLAKIHAGFYRLSEDLDFSIPSRQRAARSERSRAAEFLKNLLAELPGHLPEFWISQPWMAANNSTQRTAIVSYLSLIGGAADTIKIEVGLREPILTSVQQGTAQTLLLNPVDEKPILSPIPIACLSFVEAYAEKFRAALTRREPAIRDFYDLDLAVRLLNLQVDAAELILLVRQKLAMPGNEAIDVSEGRLNELRGQIMAQLRPVLRESDFQGFDLDRAFALAVAMHQRFL